MLPFKITGLDKISKSFKKLEKNIENKTRKINKTNLEAPIESDREGYLDKECPDCNFIFKISATDTGNSLNHLTCPSCGARKTTKAYLPRFQKQKLKELATEYVAHEINSALQKAGFKKRSTRSPLISQKFRNSEGKYVICSLPLKASEPLTQKRKCEKCFKHFAFLRSAYYCPYCSFLDYEESFKRNISTIKNFPEAIRIFKTQSDLEDSENFIRILVENGCEDLVTQFQTITEYYYQKDPKAQKIRPNLFQNLRDGSLEWKKITGRSFKSYLSEVEYEKLSKLFEMRHKFSHTDGRADTKYIKNSKDKSLQIGQRLNASSSQLIEFASIIQKLVENIKKS